MNAISIGHSGFRAASHRGILKEHFSVTDTKFTDVSIPVVTIPKVTPQVTDTAVKEAPKIATHTINKPAAEDALLMKYDDLNHTSSRLFFHVWSDHKVLAVTSTDVTFNTTEDYMVMILRFPFSSKSEYFATATSFIDAGLTDLEYVDNMDRLYDLDLD